jgi:hypothetical protein
VLCRTTQHWRSCGALGRLMITMQAQVRRVALQGQRKPFDCRPLASALLPLTSLRQLAICDLRISRPRKAGTCAAATRAPLSTVSTGDGKADAPRYLVRLLGCTRHVRLPNVCDNKLRDGGLRACTAVVALDVSVNDVGAAGVVEVRHALEALAATAASAAAAAGTPAGAPPTPAQPGALNVAGNPLKISDPGMLALAPARRALTGLQQLGVSGVRLTGASAVERLAAAVVCLKALQAFKLSDEFGPAGAAEVAPALGALQPFECAGHWICWPWQRRGEGTAQRSGRAHEPCGASYSGQRDRHICGGGVRELAEALLRLTQFTALKVSGT